MANVEWKEKHTGQPLGQYLRRGAGEAELIDGHFPFTQFREDAQRFGDDRVKGNMVLDRKYAPLLLDLLNGPNLGALQPSRSPYTGKSQLVVKVSLGGGVKMEGQSFGRALLLPEDGYEYVPLPQGLTLEVGLPDGKGDSWREALQQPDLRAQLLDALFAPVPTTTPASLTLNSGFGTLGLQSLVVSERPKAEALLDTYIAGPVGQFSARSAQMLGAAHVIVVDRVPERLQMAEKAGCQTINYEEEDVLIALLEATGGRGPDHVIDAVGMEAHGHGPGSTLHKVQQNLKLTFDRITALRWAILSCAKGGTVSLPGVYGGLVDKMPMGAAFGKGLVFRMGQTHTHRYLPDLLGRIESGQIDPSFVITHRATLEEAPELYKTFRDKHDGCVKVVLNPWG